MTRRRFPLVLLIWTLLPQPIVPNAFAQTTPQISKSVVIKRVVERLVSDGTTAKWTLSKTPTDNANVDVYLNGLLCLEGSDYTLSGTTLTWVWSKVPAASDTLVVKYWAVFNA